MASREGGHADDVDVRLHRLAGHFRRGLEEGADVDVEAEVGEGRRDDLLAAVVAVLAHLRHQDAGAAALGLSERVHQGPGAFHGRRLACLVAVHTGDRTDPARVTAEHLLQGVRDLPHRRLRAGGADREVQEVALAGGRAGQVVQGVAARLLVAFGAQAAEFVDLAGADGGVVDAQDLDVLVGGHPVLVDADHRLAARVDTRLGAGGGLLDAEFGDALVDRAGHAAGLLDLLDVLPGAARQVVGQALDVRAAAPRVDHPCRARLLLDQQLRVAGDAGREVRGQGEGLVQGVRVQGLGVALGRGHRLHAGAGDVVEDVLRCQGPARGL